MLVVCHRSFRLSCLVGLLSSLQWSATACAQSGPAGGALSEFNLDRKAGEGRDLPAFLREISGLAMTEEGRALGHHDEAGIVYEIDLGRGEVVKEFYLGNDPVPADFEGIAVVGDRVYMVTSDGTIYESPEGADKQEVSYRVYETGIGQQCEVEGLAFDSRAQVLLLPCKRARVKTLEGSVVIFRWSTEGHRMADPSRITIPRRQLRLGLLRDEFRPSAIEVHPVAGTYFLLSVRGPAIAEITPEGTVLDLRRLSGGAHRQPEGIAFTPDLDMAIADEGKDNGRVTLYRLSPTRQ